MKTVKTAFVRIEGDCVNFMCTIEFDDGTQEKYYSFDGESIKFEENDGCVANRDNILADYLETLWDRAQPLLDNEYGACEVLFDNVGTACSIEQFDENGVLV